MQILSYYNTLNERVLKNRLLFNKILTVTEAVNAKQCVALYNMKTGVRKFKRCFNVVFYFNAVRL